MKIILLGTIASSLYTFRKDLILSLVNKGYTVYAFTSDSDKVELAKIAQLGAIPTHYELSRGGLNPYEDLSNTISLYQKIKKIQPDIVLSYFIKPVIYGTLAAKLAKVPKKIAMIEGLGFAFTEQPEGYSKKAKIVQRVQVALFKLALPFADKIIFLNPDDVSDLLCKHNIPVRHYEVLGGIGLKLSDYPHQPVNPKNDETNFLFIGRLLKEKGIFDFIEAAKIVKQRYPNAKFTVLGRTDADNPGALHADQVQELVATGVIDYPGQVANVVDWITNGDVFVLPSYREGVPRSTQEAMAVGRAVITTDVPGCRETVIDGKNGFIVPKWNPQALAEKMVHFIENPEQIQVMGEESYKIAQEKFDAHKVNERLLKILGV
ncbi:glycosyltransferase family 4 protein [Moraxella sp. PS-22]|uniref:Glycosyltransferase family 4 protein n=1 Tax=Moraxella tetraodonis TaxID=2767221 RepID=A0A9X1URS6_9GAMM|nr:glycosyltransferase family 4 protein [Moraxella tetraodonis]MCG8147761.1 glycosyltransferase family 4 protein [Moraxella tetraodonis]